MFIRLPHCDWQGSKFAEKYRCGAVPVRTVPDFFGAGAVLVRTVHEFPGAGAVPVHIFSRFIGASAVPVLRYLKRLR